MAAWGSLYTFAEELYISRGPPTWPEEQQNQLHRALWFATLVVGSLVVSHLCMTAYIAWYDLTGRWDRYSLKYQHNTIWTYLSHAHSFFFDVFILLFPALALYGFYYDRVVWEPVLKNGGDPLRDGLRVLVLLTGAVVNNVINRLWAMALHWVMHMNKYLYQWVHRRHHVSIRDMCALSAWQDSSLEFVLMEVLGVFLFSQFFNPLPWQFHVLLAVYNGVGGSIDHSGFYVPGTLIDGRYHWDHHLLVNYNYSEIEFLDKVFGTLHVRAPESVDAEPPRLKRKRLEARAGALYRKKDVDKGDSEAPTKHSNHGTAPAGR